MTREHNFSFSKLSVFESCARRYFYQYIQRLPTYPRPWFSFGSSIHRTLQEFHAGEQCPSLAEVQAMFRRNWISKTGFTSAREEQHYFSVGLEILEDYQRRAALNYITPVGREDRFSIEIDGCTVSGVIDRIDRTTDGSLEVIDYKTSKRLPEMSELIDDLQLGLYGKAVEQIFGHYPQRLSYYFLRQGEKLSISPDSGFRETIDRRLSMLLQSVLAATERSEFAAAPSANCIYCDFFNACPEGQRTSQSSVNFRDIEHAVDEQPSKAWQATFEEQSQRILERAGHDEIERQIGLLRRYFAFDHFRPGQLEVILSVLQNTEVLAVMPTGAGKSLCYQMLSLQLSGVTVVISPLIALMKDQVDSIRELGIKWATFLNTSLSLQQYQQRIASIADGRSRLVYLAPEALRNRSIIRVLDRVGVSLLVIDEAHCISQWGHDFRPDYLAIRQLRTRWSGCNVLAMTATATPLVQRDIQNQLGVERMNMLCTGADRPNIYLHVNHVMSDSEKRALLVETLENLAGSAIIYVNTRKHAERVTEFLAEHGFTVACYHAGLERKVRTTIQDSFMSGATPFVVATNAFGMGIDKSDIRAIIHYHMPGTLEAYYQEIGRAGRDGAEATAMLLYSDSDRGIQQYFIEGSLIAEDKLRALLETMKNYQFKNYLLIPYGDLESKTSLDETQVRVAIAQMEKEGIFTRLPDLSLEFVVTRSPFGDPRSLDEQDHEFFDRLVSLLGNELEQGCRMSLKNLSTQLNMTPDATEEALLTLKVTSVISLKTVQKGLALRLPPQRTPRNVSDIHRGLLRIAEEKMGKLNCLVQFALTPICRRTVVLNYFGEEPERERCGFCDNCTGGSRKSALIEQATPSAIPLNPLLELLNMMKYPLGRKRIAEILGGSESREITSRNFHLLPAYGSLAGTGAKRIVLLVDQAIRSGYIDIFYRPDDTLHRFPLLRIADAGRSLLATGRKYWLEPPEDAVKSVAERKRKKKASKAEIEVEVKGRVKKPLTPKRKASPPTRVAVDDRRGSQGDLYEALREWRQKTASKLRTQAYRIFSNATLQAIADTRPESYDDLKEISGIGPVKLTDYGKQLLEIVSFYRHDDDK